MSELDNIFKAIGETRKLQEEQANGVSLERREEILEEKKRIMRNLEIKI